MFLTGCGTPEPAASLSPAAPQGRKTDFPENDLASTEITLRRGSCYGPCPIYGVTIRGTGDVTWSGYRYVAFAGTLDYRVAPKRSPPWSNGSGPRASSRSQTSTKQP
uniref:DUF6438 domain-containing protein n=1 Tax=Oleomonas cavernae TaxID=2320859 RepID=UPI0038D014C2